MHLTIDRDAYEPAYAQLANILRRQIAEGIYRSGDRLPSEAQLCKQYGVSPMTVRRSINLLAAQDVVSTAQGRGTFVKPLEINKATFHLPRFNELFDDTHDVEVRLLEVRIRPADERVASKLCLQENDKVIYLRRLLKQKENPVFYHRTFLHFNPRQPFIEAEMDTPSLENFFISSDHELLKFGELKVEVTNLDDEESELLQVPCGTAAFHLEHMFYDFENRPVSWGWFIWRGDKLRFTTTVGIDTAA